NWHDDPRTDLVRQAPAVVDVRHHHSDVGQRKPRRCRYVSIVDVVERRELGEKETMIFPGQLDEIAAVPEDLEPKTSVKIARAPDISHQDLRHELLCGMHVRSHGYFLTPTPRGRAPHPAWTALPASPDTRAPRPRGRARAPRECGARRTRGTGAMPCRTAAEAPRAPILAPASAAASGRRRTSAGHPGARLRARAAPSALPRRCSCVSRCHRSDDGVRSERRRLPPCRRRRPAPRAGGSESGHTSPPDRNTRGWRRRPSW